MGSVIKRRDFPVAIEQSRQGVFVLASKVTVLVTASTVNAGKHFGETANDSPFYGATNVG